MSIVLGIGLMIGCKEDFLQVDPAGSLLSTQLNTKKGVEGLLIGTYAAIAGSGGKRMVHPWNWVWGSIRGGDANKGTDPGDFSDINPIQTFNYQSTQGVINDNYQGLYEIIARANNTLKILSTSTDPLITDDDRNRIIGEAKFLRAHAYFSLKRNFNNTPFVDENTPFGVYGNDTELWPKIEEDMKDAVTKLPELQAQIGRANKWAARAYLGKIYLYQKKYTEAKAEFDAVIANGVTPKGVRYALVPKFGDLFKASNDNNPESIFAVQAAANTGSVNNANADGDLNYPYNTGPNGPGNCCGFFQPSFELGNSYRTFNGLPLLDKSYNNVTNSVKTDMGVTSDQAFTEDAGPLDPRIDWTIGRRGIPYLDWQDHPGAAWIRNQPNGGPYSPKKYSYYKSDKGSLQDNSSWTPGYTALNYTIIRYADVLLMAAECEVEVGTLEKAREYVNMIRTRAANSEGFVKNSNGTNAANYVINTYSVDFPTYAGLIQASLGITITPKDLARLVVQFERKLELAMEGHRFYDLVRWGTDVVEINAYLGYEHGAGRLPNTLPGSGAYLPKHRLLPIPQAEIDLVNGSGTATITQNP
ncbi:MAG: hypothetical protein RIR51_1869 [Bacteroidota bacterium]